MGSGRRRQNDLEERDTKSSTLGKFRRPSMTTEAGRVTGGGLLQRRRRLPASLQSERGLRMEEDNRVERERKPRGERGNREEREFSDARQIPAPSTMTEDSFVAGGGGWADSGARREMEEESCGELGRSQSVRERKRERERARKFEDIGFHCGRGRGASEVRENQIGSHRN